MNSIRRLYVEKKEGFDVEAQSLLSDLKENLGIKELKSLRILYRYDISEISDKIYDESRTTIFSEPPIDYVYDEFFKVYPDEKVFGIEYLPGQYDQRADSAMQCIQVLSHQDPPLITTAKIIILNGNISEEVFVKIKSYCINPVDSTDADLEKPETLKQVIDEPENVGLVSGFRDFSQTRLVLLMDELGLAMSQDDLEYTRLYFRNEEKRDPTVTEIKVLDTYWSDHCRHTTFLTKIENVEFDTGLYAAAVKNAFAMYLQSREYVYGQHQKDMSLMDLAIIPVKDLRKKGMLDRLDISDEINACSISVQVDVDGKNEDWLVMFKNETHNHPTEIEPFGGAATCLGGAIRDPLSGRTYVYQAMRVSGSGDPRAKVEETLPGKLPQRTITTKAAHGYSSYGNQIGLATGLVTEIYDQGYVAKRMEIGAVIAAAPKKNVRREKPESGDMILLVGGRTGRDGIGGATGSSKAHTEHALKNEAEVQKGNPPTERKLQRLFRNPEASRLIKKSNDFGAGGVSVAIGELSDGLDIFLDAVPKKYEGLDGTELAISESQERMAVVIAPDDVQKFSEFAADENLEITPVAKVTDLNRLRMFWREQKIVDIDRKFLDTNGVSQNTNIAVASPDSTKNYFTSLPKEVEMNKSNFKESFLANLRDLGIAGQRGLIERFDSTIGASTVLHPFGGKYQITPAEAMVAKIPMFHEVTSSATLMSFGFDPKLSTWSPFHGALYAVIESVARIVASGGDYKRAYLTLQEYFEKLGADKYKWGKPFSALLGAFYAQMNLGIAAIGGKDSMSGTFENLNVPPTLVSFAVDVADASDIISPEFKESGNYVIFLPLPRDGEEVPDFEYLSKMYSMITRLIRKEKIVAAQTVRYGGIAAAIGKMSFGNRIGARLTDISDFNELFTPELGSFVVELSASENPESLFDGFKFRILGQTTDAQIIQYGTTKISIEEAVKEWESPLEQVFPSKTTFHNEKPANINYETRNNRRSAIKIAKPRVFIPVFPGTNCEYDSARAFNQAGGVSKIFVLKNLSSKDLNESLKLMAKEINNAQIVMLPGGFSAGDEPEGSGKFIAAVFRNPAIKEAVMNLLNTRDGLMLGICNGFQALIKLGLLPYGEIRGMDENSPTLTFNEIGRHVSRMVHTKVVSVQSPWLANSDLGEIHTVAVSHGEGRFVAPREVVDELIRNGQIATQYVNLDGNPTYDIDFNPNGSQHAIEGITSIDGKIFGKMAHSERIGKFVGKNIPGNKDQKIFKAGVKYFD
ncbi:MAG: phosphoribosylformylglycinamidine synthase [Calditrichaceae bacterium]